MGYLLGERGGDIFGLIQKWEKGNFDFGQIFIWKKDKCLVLGHVGSNLGDSGGDISRFPDYRNNQRTISSKTRTKNAICVQNLKIYKCVFNI